MFFSKIRSRLRNRVTKKAVLEELREVKKELGVLKNITVAMGEALLAAPLAKKEGDLPTEAQVKSEWFGEDD